LPERALSAEQRPRALSLVSDIAEGWQRSPSFVMGRRVCRIIIFLQEADTILMNSRGLVW
jgi:hypothetical protein